MIVTEQTRGAALLRRLVEVHPGEGAALAWSFVYFFCLLCSYYVLRPVRDEMGIAGGIGNLPWVFTATFAVMLAAVPLFGAVAARYPRRTFVPLVYYFFIVNLLLFYVLFETLRGPWIARAFFVWVSVFNLFVVSVFWSLMVDLYRNEQARRLFGFIAAGGSAGAIVGPLLTATLVGPVGAINLLLVAALLLGAATLCIQRLLTWNHALRGAREPAQGDPPMGGSVFAGLRLVATSPYLLGICLFLLLFTSLSTFLYFEQAHIIKETFEDSGQRTRLFALIDLAVNILTVTTQLFIAGRIMSRFRLGVALAAIPLLVAAGFATLALLPTLAVLVAFQVVRRAGNYALTRPAREVLFTVVNRESKYKAKNFIDTVVYRGGDAASGWGFGLLEGAGLSLANISWIAVPIAGAWVLTALALGRSHERLRQLRARA